MLVRMFGIFGAMLAFAYLLQGVSFIRPVLTFLARRSEESFLWAYTVMALDFSFGISLLIAAIGLLFEQEWARKMWLIVTSALVFVHLVVIVRSQFFGRGATSFYFVWTWMVLLSTALAWWYLSKPSVRTRFIRKEPEIETESVSPAA